MLSLGAALTMSDDAVSLIQDRLRSVAAAYGYPHARISLFPTLVIVALREREPATVRTIDSVRQLRLDQASEVIAVARRTERAEVAPAEALAKLREILASRPRFGPTAYIASHGVLTIGLGLVIHPAAVELWVYAALGRRRRADRHHRGRRRERGRGLGELPQRARLGPLDRARRPRRHDGRAGGQGARGRFAFTWVNRSPSVSPRASTAYARAVAEVDTGNGPDATVPPPRHHRPWGWIAACVLLLLVAGGLAIWALSLQGDLDDQRDQTAQAQQQAEQAGNDVEALKGQVDEISQSVSDAGDQLSQAGADAEENAQQTLDGLGTKLESLKGEVENAIENSGASQDGSAP